MKQARKPPREAFGPLVALVARQWRRAVDRRLQPFGLTEATWLPLIHLARARDPMRQKDLAASLVLDGSSVVRLLDALESAGLIERREEAGDRRAKTIAVTERGRAIIEQVEAVSREIREAALDGANAAELAAAARLLELIRDNLETMLEGTGDDGLARALRHRG